MSGEIVFELNIFAKAIMLGVICGLFYDCIRIGRRIVKKKYIATSIEDLLYWSIAAIIVCVFLYKNNGGTIRGYVIFAMALGMILCELSLGRFIVKYLTMILSWIIDKIRKILSKLWKIAYLGLKKVFKPFKIVFTILVGKIKSKNKKKKSTKANKRPKKRGARIEKKKR